MSDDAYDYTTGRGLASGGGTPDWNNQSQVDGYYAQKNWEAVNASMNPPPPSTSYSNTNDDSTPWGVHSDYSSSSNYSSSSYSGRSSSQDVRWTSSDVVTALGLLLGGYAGYSLASSYHGTSLELWLTTGCAALGVAFLCHLLAEVIKGSMSLSEAAGTVILVVSGFVSGVLGYWYAENQHGSTVELWLAAALAALGAVFFWAFVANLFKGRRRLFTLGSMFALLAGGYAGHTYYDGTPLQDWLAAGVSALAIGFCAWIIEEIKSKVAMQQPTKGLAAKKRRGNQI